MSWRMVRTTMLSLFLVADTAIVSYLARDNLLSAQHRARDTAQLLSVDGFLADESLKLGGG